MYELLYINTIELIANGLFYVRKIIQIQNDAWKKQKNKYALLKSEKKIFIKYIKK